MQEPTQLVHCDQRPRLDTLPREITAVIFSYVQEHHGDQLTSLKRTNSTLKEIADRTTSQVLSVGVLDDCNQLYAKLHKNECLGAVRRLIIRGTQYTCIDGVSLAEEMPPTTGAIQGFDTDFDYKWAALRLKCAYSTGFCPAHYYRDHPFWSKLAVLIKALPGLKEVSCACIHQIPRAVLDAIAAPPGSICKLEIHNFNFSTGFRQEHIILNEYHLALLTSPSLHSIGISESASNRSYLGREQQSTMSQLVALFARSVKVITIYRRTIIPRCEPFSWSYNGSLDTSHKRLLPLHTLSFKDLASTINIHELPVLSRFVDWQELQELSLDSAFTSLSAEQLFALSLPALRKLSLKDDF